MGDNDYHLNSYITLNNRNYHYLQYKINNSIE